MVNENESNNRLVRSGLLLESILGLTLFIIYINDLPECVKANTYLLADDTKFSEK